MAQRMPDGTIRMQDGTIHYGNSIPLLEHWPELLELFRFPPQAAPLRTAPEFNPVFESLFKDHKGRVYTFRLESGKEYANLTVNAKDCLNIGIQALNSRREVDRAYELLGIQDRESGAGLWFHACLQSMKKEFPERKKR